MCRVPLSSLLSRVYPPRRHGPRCYVAFVAFFMMATTGLGQVAVPGSVDAPPKATLPPPEGATRLDAEQPVWIDAKKNTVYVDGWIALREGVLEMFACPAGTKEHESIVAVDAAAELIHVALLAVGAEPGHPVRYNPRYEPPTGTQIDVTASWPIEGNPKEMKTVRAQTLIRYASTGEPMNLPFVFAGSTRWTDPETKITYYGAEAGDLICVSNFGTAMLDVPAPSTDNNGGLWFEPFTDRIPPLDTPVRLALKPVAAAAKEGEPPSDEPAALGPALAVILQAKVGDGTEKPFRAAWKELSEMPPKQLPKLLIAMKDASPLAVNHLRMAIDAIADSHEPSQLPKAALQEFLDDLSQSPRARRTAFELIRRIDPSGAEEMLDEMVNDPSDEIRYDAIAKLLKVAEEAPESERIPLLRRALRASRSLDQMETAAKRLEKLGEEVVLADELGMIMKWLVIGPFDNRGGDGFNTVYPPEEQLDATAQYTGHDEEGPQGPFGWKRYESDDRLGEVELNDAIGPHKGAVGYAWTKVESDKIQPIVVRYSSKCATKVWVNGYLVAEHEAYHAGSPFDQYQATAELDQGTNTILVKVCQNEQTQPWTRTWPLQLRLTDPAGGLLEGVRVTELPSVD